MRLTRILFFLILIGAVIYVGARPTIWGPLVYPLIYKDAIKTYAQDTALDPNLVAAMIYQESRFNAGQESRAGAVGLMQLVPHTAASVAAKLGDHDYSGDKLLDPDRNIRYGTYYMKYLMDKYNDLDLALAAYNGGETNVDQWRREGRIDIPFPETKQFVSNVKKTKTMYDTIYGKWYAG